MLFRCCRTQSVVTPPLDTSPSEHAGKVSQHPDIKKPSPPRDDAFLELELGYYHMKSPKVMSQRLQCSYSNNHNVYRTTIILGKPVDAKKTTNGKPYISIPVELRGITLRQLRAVYANALRRCIEEAWVDPIGKKIVTPENVNLYHINEYVIKPFTKDTQKSFVESLPSTAGTQPPRFFISHMWGEPFCHTLACIEQLVKDFSKNNTKEDEARGGGMTEDTPIWVCAFANNQWDLGEAITSDPMDSSFFKAMRAAGFRTVSILDANGVVFTRIWCDYEVHATLTSDRKATDPMGHWAIYTAHQHRFKNFLGDPEDRAAVGIISGGAPSETALLTSDREQYFPPELILQSLGIKIECANASKESDRFHILNTIIGNKDNLDAVPPSSHPKFDDLNDAVKGAFAASVPALKAALLEGDEEWKMMLRALSKGSQTGTFKLLLDSFHHPGPLSSTEARELVAHVPATRTGLEISFADGEDGEGAIYGTIDWLEKVKVLKKLSCHNCRVGDVEKGLFLGSLLADALASSRHAKSIEVLHIADTDLMDSKNVADWALALQQMTTLKKLVCRVVISDEDREFLRSKTHATDISF